MPIKNDKLLYLAVEEIDSFIKTIEDARSQNTECDGGDWDTFNETIKVCTRLLNVGLIVSRISALNPAKDQTEDINR